VLSLSLQIWPETLRTLKRIRRDINIYGNNTSRKVRRYSCQILIKIEFLDIQGASNMTGTVYTCLNTNQSRSYWNHLVFPENNTQVPNLMKIRPEREPNRSTCTDIQTDRNDKVNIRLPRFCERS